MALMQPKKKPGVTVAIGVGKPPAPPPMKGGPLAALLAGGKPGGSAKPSMDDSTAGMEEAAPDDEMGESSQLDSIESKLDKIIEALGLDGGEESEPDAGAEGDDEGAEGMAKAG